MITESIIKFIIFSIFLAATDAGSFNNSVAGQQVGRHISETSKPA